MRVTAAALASILTVSGCFFPDVLGESQTWIDLYNPQTREQAHCGLPMHPGAPSETELRDRKMCMAEYAAKGYRPLTNSDLESSINSGDTALNCWAELSWPSE